MVIETERLILRRLTVDDLDELVALQAHPEIVRFMGPAERHDVEWVAGVDDDAFLGRPMIVHAASAPEVRLARQQSLTREA